MMRKKEEMFGVYQIQLANNQHNGWEKRMLGFFLSHEYTNAVSHEFTNVVSCEFTNLPCCGGLK
jgi:hypothetical protein